MATRLRASEILHGFDRFLLSIPHWEVASGQVVALLGPSGSGKSTFLNMLGARMVPDEGKVWYAGKPHKRIPLFRGIPASAWSDRILAKCPTSLSEITCWSFRAFDQKQLSIAW